MLTHPQQGLLGDRCGEVSLFLGLVEAGVALLVLFRESARGGSGSSGLATDDSWQSLIMGMAGQLTYVF
jgi:hypothetical protein